MPSVEYTRAKGLVQKSSTDATLKLQGELHGNRHSLETISGDKTLTSDDSNKVFLMADADITVNLPAAAVAGTKFRFIAAVDIDNNAVEIVQEAGAEDFQGILLDGAGGVVAQDLAAHSLVRFVAGTAVAGDFVECVSTGSKWNIKAAGRAAGGIIFA